MYGTPRLDRWPIFSLLEESFRNDITTALVFGSTGHEAIMQLKNLDVYAVGANACCCLGIGDEASVMEPRKVPELCGKKIASISSGCGPHVVCSLEDGSVYSWGHNGYSQLGTGNPSSGQSPTQVACNIEGRKIIKVACGAHHTLALTDQGEVYSWGQNNCGQIGSGCSTNQTIPRRVTACIGNKRVVDVCCSQTCSLILVDNGQVYAWGYNGNGQLGLGSTTNQPNPTRIAAFSDTVIKKIMTGTTHCLALSESGDIFAWGGNLYGQLGTGNKNNFMSPLKVNMKNEFHRFIDIAASPMSHISVAMASIGEVFIWGQCRGQAVTLPMKTKFNCMDDVFAMFSGPAVTYRPLQLLSNTMVEGILSDICNSFDDEETTDTQFIVADKPIRVHRAFLKIRCGYFRAMFRDGSWNEGKQDRLEISDFSYNVYRAFLNFLYTDSVDSSLNMEELIDLIDLANQCCEFRLKCICAASLQALISIANVASLYRVGVSYDAKELADFALSFAFHHMTAIVKTEAFETLDQITMRKLVTDVAAMGAFKH